MPERKSAKHAAEAVPDIWQPQEIAAAKARCDVLLKDIDAVVVPQPPLKEGKCGAPAPVRLVSLGKKPQVSFEPPALVNCEMVAALHKWLKSDLQPLAAKHLGAKIIKVEVMSDYSCRAALGRGKDRLSEHAFADALDIRGFVTDKGQTAHVLDEWGTTARDIAALAKAKAQAEKNVAAQSGDGKPSLTASGAGVAKTAIINGGDKVTASLLGAHSSSAETFGLAAKLGGPGGKATPGAGSATKFAALSPQLPAAAPSPPKVQFLHAAHDAACRIFGTTLGPEANEAHRNHFHVDMAERKVKKICDF